jgi:hypothetical protein
MNERTKSKTKKATGVRVGILRSLWRYVLGIFVVIVVICVFVVSSITQDEPKEPVLLPPHEIAVKVCAYHLVDKIEEALSYSLDRPDKDNYIRALMTGREHYEHLEYKLGPIEIRENENLNEANRVVVPNISMKIKKKSTGEIITQPREGIPKIAETVLEKRDTPEGPQWYVLTGKQFAEIESTWLNLPRKKVPRSPTIIIKKAVVMQIVSDDGKVVHERTVFWME